jgi:hypothetical protein
VRQGHGADLVELGRARRLELGVLGGHEDKQAIARQDLVDELIERSWPMVNGIIVSGKTTVSRSGSTGRTEGISCCASSA